MSSSWSRWAAALLVSVAGGCKFDRPADVLGPTDAAIDARYECVPDTIACDEDHGVYVECSSDGTVIRQFPCALGCAADVEKCVDIDPSNAFADQLDMARDRTDAPALVFTGTATIDTTTGEISINGQNVAVPNVVLNSARIYMVKSLVVEPVAVVQARGLPALVFVVDGDVTIRGTIDISAHADVPGPGDYSACLGQPTDLVDNVSNGGGGGGGWTAGGDGGNAGDGQPGAAGGSAALPEDGQPLRRGCAGGLGGELGPAGGFSTAGAGGGAHQITSRGRIRIIGGAINAAGGGARIYQIEAAASSISGGGGGAGGTILLEAPEVSLESAGVPLSANGGGGSAAGRGLGGGEDGRSDGPGRGGITANFASGGRGGSAVALPERGWNGPSAGADGGGGGGAVGVVRINTASGKATIQPGASIGAHYSSGVIRSRLIP